MSGEGPPLLLLSPYAVPAASLAGLQNELAKRFRVISFDYPGSGRAHLPIDVMAPGPLTIPALAASAVRLLDHLGVASATVVGVSMGGFVAQELALLYPERVDGLVLASSSAGGPHSRRGTVWDFKPSHMTGSGFEDGTTPFAGITPWGAFFQAAAASVHDTSRRLQHIQADTLVLHGQRDRIVPPENSRQLADGIPSSRLHIEPHIGHLLAFRYPREVAESIFDWWDSASLSAGTASDRTRKLRPFAPLGAMTLGPAMLYLTAWQSAVLGSTRLARRAFG